jgi:putative sporulation protein YyaC
VETPFDDPYAAARISRALDAAIDDRPVVFACIGTDRSTGDAFGPLVGDRLRAGGADVVGTLEEPLHALNLTHRLQQLAARASDPLVVAVDAALGPRERVGTICVHPRGISPGRAMGKQLDEVGEISITATVNVAGGDRERVLQSTRLFFVARVAEIVAAGCGYALEGRRTPRRVRAA